MNTFDRDQPFNDLPALPPSIDVQTKAVLHAVIAATRSLAELKGKTNTIPNPNILINTLSLQEARSSSEIENIFTTNDELYCGLSLETPGLSAEQKEVLHYNDALWAGAEKLRERPFLTANLAVEIVNTIKGNTAGIRLAPGTRIANPTSHEVIYTPPEGEDVIRLLSNLEEFANREDDGFDPLVKMAIIHYQFEAIHPFHDGNGRAGRVLLILFLLMRDLLDQPILFLSRYIIANKNSYYRHLRDVTETGAWEPWLLYMLRAVDSTAMGTRRKLEAIANLLREMIEEARQKLSPKIFRKELIEILFERPYCKIAFLEKIAQRATASKYLSALEEAGLVRSRKIGREIVFINHRLLSLLSEPDPS